MADIMAPSLALGLFLTRIGCFLNGCCYGKPTDLPWGVTFPPEAFGGRLFGETPLHPAQLYSSLAGLLILLLLLLYDRRPRAEGQVFSLYLILAGLARFLLDFVRSYEANVYILGPFTVNQMISIGSCLLGLLLLGVTRRAGVAAGAGTSGGEVVRTQRSA
jgi:phosphatidylglycerol:prolipoprotein diacylglycerol transferase